MTKVVNIRYSNYDIYVGRAGKGQSGYFGNPFLIGKDGTREEVINKYKIYFYNRISTEKEFKNQILELKDKILGCFCKNADGNGLVCHADIIKEYLDNL